MFTLKNRFSYLIFILSLLFSMQAITVQASDQMQHSKKKVLFVNSYDLDFSWSLDLVKGALDVFNVKIDQNLQLDTSECLVDFKIFNMKTKKNKSPEYIEKTALEVKELIDTWQPDVVICADDNASKFVIVPYFKDSKIPFVFCGVNWSAEEYGFPTSNVTGMIEVFPIQAALDIVRPFAKGDRLGFLSNDTFSERKNAAYIEKLFDVNMTSRFVSNYDEFEQQFKALQKEVDMLMIIEHESFPGFDEERFNTLTENHVSIPNFSFAFRRLANYLVILKRKGAEQGGWAAKTALEILDGKSPADIPITMNRNAAVRLNMKMAKKLGIKFPMDVIQNAVFVIDDEGRGHKAKYNLD